jgi:RNA polymerase sigma-70 factor (ECF subfamily)
MSPNQLSGHKVEIEEQAHQARQALAEIQSAVIALYQAQATKLLRYARTLTPDTDIAQEAVQESFLRYFEACVRGEAPEEGKGWLFRVARNYIYDRLKQHALRRKAALAAIADQPDGHLDPEAELARAEISQCVVDSLSPRERECLRLRAEGLRYREIATVLNIQPGTVGALIARGLEKMRKALKTG